MSDEITLQDYRVKRAAIMLQARRAAGMTNGIYKDDGEFAEEERLDRRSR